MGDVVNLRSARKHKARADKERTASENRALHGRTKVEKQRDRMQADTSATFIEAHRIERPDKP